MKFCLNIFRTHILVLIVCKLSFWSSLAQEKDTFNTTKFSSKIINGDTLYIADVDPVYILVPTETANMDKKELQKYLKLVRNVKKAYPYAKLAQKRLKEIDEGLSKISGKKERKAYLDKTEKELTDEIKPIAKNLTIAQGRILMKLIDRETGNSAYSLVKELKGSFSAVFYQSLARIFGSNLKLKYDPLGEDRDIEEIVLKLEKEESENKSSVR